MRGFNPEERNSENNWDVFTKKTQKDKKSIEKKSMSRMKITRESGSIEKKELGKMRQEVSNE